MANEQAATAVQVESILFPPSLKPPGSTNTFLLGGADRPGGVSIALPYLKEDVFHEVGVRGLDIQGKFVKFSGIGIYLEEDKAISSLALKWNGKTAEELRDSDDFFRDIVTGPFEKFSKVTLISTLTGKQFSEKVAENCVRDWKSLGIYTQDDAKDIDKFLEIFKDRNFPPGSSILFTVSPGEAGSLSISFSEDDSVWPEAANAVLENGKLGQAVIYSQIGKNGVSPAAKQSLALRLSDLMNQFDHKTNGNGSKFKVCVI